MSQQQQTGLKRRAPFRIRVLEAEKEVCKMCCCSVFIVILQLWAETRKVYSNPVTTVICALLQGSLIDCLASGKRKQGTKKSKQTQRQHRQLHRDQGLSSDIGVTRPLTAQALPPDCPKSGTARGAHSEAYEKDPVPSV